MTLSQMQEQAWASVSPSMVLQELTQSYQLKVDGDRLTVAPAPGPRLTFQIRRIKAKILELMGAGKTTRQRVDEAWKARGVDVDTYQVQERESYKLEASYKGPITFPPMEESPEVQQPWETPIIERIKQEYCQHTNAGHYRVKTEDGSQIKLLCPDCGRNMKGPRRFTEPKKRSTIPWWPKGSKVTPDPDAETDALVEGWSSVEADVADGCTFSQGIVIDDAGQFKQNITELIGLWKLGDPDHGLKAQLLAHKRHLQEQEQPCRH